jgi:gamma-glutamyltranspeptidase/glutathione hydrolase
MDLQEAIDAPTVHTSHFPSSFYPRGTALNQMTAEGRISGETLEALRAKGHEVTVAGDWVNGRVMAARMNDNGVLEAAASPRYQTAYALGW